VTSPEIASHAQAYCPHFAGALVMLIALVLVADE
jgi:hypothetical protein